MSVVVKDVKMPKCCRDCDFEVADEYDIVHECFLIYKGYTNETRIHGRLKACPLVELPEKHGRLIDVDELIEFIENRYDVTWTDDYEGGVKDACTDILEKINDTPIVIEEDGNLK